MNLFLDYSYDLQRYGFGSYVSSCAEFPEERYLDRRPHEALAGRLRLTRQRLEEGAKAPRIQYPKRLARQCVADCITWAVQQLVVPDLYVVCKYWIKSEAFELTLRKGNDERKIVLDLEGDWVRQIDEALAVTSSPHVFIFPQLQDPDFFDTVVADESDTMPSIGVARSSSGSRIQFLEAVMAAGQPSKEMFARHENGKLSWSWPLGGMKKPVPEGPPSNVAVSRQEQMEGRSKRSPARLGSLLHEMFAHAFADPTAYDRRTRPVFEADYHELELNVLKNVRQGAPSTSQATLYAASVAKLTKPKREPWELRPALTQLALDVIQQHVHIVEALWKALHLVSDYDDADQKVLLRYFRSELLRFRDAKVTLRTDRLDEGHGR